jgi:hypothetical protein
MKMKLTTFPEGQPTFVFFIFYIHGVDVLTGFTDMGSTLMLHTVTSSNIIWQWVLGKYAVYLFIIFLQDAS